jgi:hypothetical protein
MSWFLGRRSKLSTNNKLLLYKCIIKPIWTYGNQLWGCAKPTHTKIIQRIQSKILRTAINAPWYVSNWSLHNDLQWRDSQIVETLQRTNRRTRQQTHSWPEYSAKCAKEAKETMAYWPSKTSRRNGNQLHHSTRLTGASSEDDATHSHIYLILHREQIVNMQLNK